MGLMNWIGRSTIYEDTENALNLLEKGLNWLFTTPWWVPGICAGVATVFLLWLLWPRKEIIAATISSGPATPSIEPVAHPSAEGQAPKDTEIPKTLLQLYKEDFNTLLRAHKEFTVNMKSGGVIKILFSVHLDFSSGIKFVSFYIPWCTESSPICKQFIQDYKKCGDDVTGGVDVIASFPGDSTSMKSNSLKYSGMIYLSRERYVP